MNISRARSRSPRKWYTPPSALSAAAIPAGSPSRRRSIRLSEMYASEASRSPRQYALVPSQLRTTAHASSSPSASATSERLAQVRLAQRVVALERRELPRPGERPAPVARRRVRTQGQRGREPEPALGVVAAGPPELGERAREPDRERAVALRGRPVEGLPDVVVGLVEPVERLDLALRRQVQLGGLDDGQHLVRVRPAGRNLLPRGREPVERVGADGGEHRVRPAAGLAAQERGARRAGRGPR